MKPTRVVRVHGAVQNESIQAPERVECVPAGQLMHVALDCAATATEYFPASQLKHAVCETAPTAVEKVPALHG